MTSSRDQILQNLRAHAAPFEDARPRPTSFLPVTRLSENGQSDLLSRFTAELEERSGSVHAVPDEQSAIRTVLDLIRADRVVIVWENLPLPGLSDALAARGVEMIIPRTRQEDRVAALLEAEAVRVGITGADAAFAATGTLALVSEKGQGRLPSLLPPVHVALLRRDRLFPRLEDWFAGEGHAALERSRSVALVTGPSSTGDIEQNSILGVHGPGDVHVVVF